MKKSLTIRKGTFSFRFIIQPAYAIIKQTMSEKPKGKHSLKIISYNLKYHRANMELSGLVERYDADILCVQECYSEQLPANISNMVLAHKTTQGRLNQAIYFRPERFQALQTESYDLKKSVLERALVSQRTERLLVSEFYDNKSRQNIMIGSFHAMHLMATNYLRRMQIESAHEILTDLSKGNPAIMVGDYNYPLFKRRLKVCIESSGYKMSLSDQPTYHISKIVRGYFDLATSVNTQIERVMTLPRGRSDHAPILVHALI